MECFLSKKFLKINVDDFWRESFVSDNCIKKANLKFIRVSFWIQYCRRKKLKLRSFSTKQKKLKLGSFSKKQNHSQKYAGPMVFFANINDMFDIALYGVHVGQTDLLLDLVWSLGRTTSSGSHVRHKNKRTKRGKC